MIERLLNSLIDLLGRIVLKIFPRLHPYYKKYREELLKMVRFFVVGVTSLILYSGLYALLSRVIWRTGNHTLENFIATVLIAILNFYLNRNWTFCRAEELSGTHARHVRRFIFVGILATLLQTLLFWFGHEYFKIYDFIVIYGVAILIACFTFTMHRFYTFHTPRGIPRNT